MTTSQELPALSPIHTAVLKVLGARPKVPTGLLSVCSALIDQGYMNVFETAVGLDELQEWGQVAATPCPESGRVWYLLTDFGRLTAYGAALGLTSVMMPVQEIEFASRIERPRGEVEYWSDTEPLRGVAGSNPHSVDTSGKDGADVMDSLGPVKQFAEGENRRLDMPSMENGTNVKSLPAGQPALGSIHFPYFKPAYGQDFIERMNVIYDRSMAEYEGGGEHTDFDTRQEMYAGIRMVK